MRGMLVDLTFLKDALHTISQGLTYPVIGLLLVAIGYAVFTVGSVVVEYLVERRYFRVAMPRFLRAIDDASDEEVPAVVDAGGLLLRQKKALLVLYSNRDLPEEARWALAKKLLGEQSGHYRRIVGRNDTVAKVAPMLGLMGTLIPLGPGIVALGTGEYTTLSDSLLIAFDTTVAGLVAAAVCMVVSKVRKSWYAEYAAALEAAVTTMLEKMDNLALEQRSQTEHGAGESQDLRPTLKAEGGADGA